MEQTIKIDVQPAESPEDIAAVRTLFTEYAGFMGFELCFRGFDGELAGLPGDYAPPMGALFLARVDGRAAGCVAIRAALPGEAEMRRLFVRPEFRDMKIGRNLAWLVMGMAREAGYSSIRLETVPGRMPRAVAMYRKLGFEAVPCPRDSDPEITCYTRTLDDLI